MFIKFKTFSKKKKSILAQLLPKLLTPKKLVAYTSKRSCFRAPFDKQRVTGFKTLLKLARHHHYRIFPRIPDKLSWKKLALV